MDQKILLMGTPNVGKSALFNRLTGLNVSVANYSGTTVDYASGTIRQGGKEVAIIDVPGTYSLCATCEAEEVAVKMVCGVNGTINPYRNTASCCSKKTSLLSDLESPPTLLVYVLDAGNFEGGLYLLLQLLELKIPLLVALNRGDLALQKGCVVDEFALTAILGIPIIPTVALSGKGVDELKGQIFTMLEAGEVSRASIANNVAATWDNVELIAEKCLRRTVTGGNKSREKWDRLLTKPWPGLMLAAVILIMVFAGIVGVGMGLRRFILLPLFKSLIIPPLFSLTAIIIPPGMIQNIFIGEYGFLVKGIEWPFTLVLPYVLSFYLVLSLLEDSGYMPRLAILLDGLFKRVGLPGSGIIPLMLGYGCGIPAIMATRALGTKKERLMVTILICLAVPCISQTGAFISLLAARSVAVMIALFLFSWLVMILVGLILNRFVKGTRPETLLEIPDLLVPRIEVIAKKLWLRLKLYITDGALPMIAAVAGAAVLYETGLMAAFGRVISPLVTLWLRLPEEAAAPLILGILRRELTVLPLLDLDLTTLQLFTGAVVGLFYVPCIAIVATVAREFRISFALVILLLTTSIAFLFGGLIARLGSVLL
jgi:ferrous iron transport protein B